MKREISYRSKDNVSKVHAVLWVPEGKLMAIVQVVHGMAEHAGRYKDFAEFLNRNGIMLVGEDHVGHGKTAANREEFGFFGGKDGADTAGRADGADVLISDVFSLTKIVTGLYPCVPYFVLGHSMGSYIARSYLARYSDEVYGGIIVGTGWEEPWVVHTGELICKGMRFFKGDRYRSRFVTKLVFGKYLSHIDSPKTENDWLCRDENVVNDFRMDELCNFTFTAEGYATLIKLVRMACDDRNIVHTRKDLPILILGGSEDPVGQYGHGVMKTYDQYKRLKHTDVSVKIYPEMRHEILNEYGNQKVYSDILNWIYKRILYINT